MSLIPQDEQKRNDALDFVIDTMKEPVERMGEDGQRVTDWVYNPDSGWYKSHRINAPFGRPAFFIKYCENLCNMFQDFMCLNRAENMKKGLMMVVTSYKRSIDAKSSETYYDKDNKQQSLVDVFAQNKVEHKYTIKGDAKKSFFDGLTGKKKDQDEE